MTGIRLQINTANIIAEEFKDLAKKHNITQGALFEFLWISFLRSGTPQTRAARLKQLEKKR